MWITGFSRLCPQRGKLCARLSPSLDIFRKIARFQSLARHQIFRRPVDVREMTRARAAKAHSPPARPPTAGKD